jgi:uncharacterized membrane protein
MSVRPLLLTAVVVASNVLGNLFLSIGVKGPSVLLIAAGVSLLILWALSRMALMSWADLSYILPVTSVGYILAALAGKYVLAEQISGARWWGTLLIFAGMIVVSRTAPRTTS